VKDDFEREYGARIRHDPFESQEEAVANLRAGKLCDLVIIENQLIPGLVAERLLAEIDFRNVPNFKNVSPSFRGMVTDPDNRHSVPYSFGTTGLLVRTDLAGGAVTRWSDLWNPRYAGKVAYRTQMRELIGLTLLSLGHSPNSEDPRHLDEALVKLLELKKTGVVAGEAPEKAAALLTGGQVWLMEGFAEDYRQAHQQSPEIAYVFPDEGILLWGDNFVIPSASRNKRLAETFINFMLRPESSARDANALGYASANEAALPLLESELRDDPATYPTPEQMRRAHFFVALSAEAQKRYEEAWRRFLAGRN
jgi:spermidine/putrescine transport system substrate-binding protein